MFGVVASSLFGFTLDVAGSDNLNFFFLLSDGPSTFEKLNNLNHVSDFHLVALQSLYLEALQSCQRLYKDLPPVITNKLITSLARLFSSTVEAVTQSLESQA